MIGKASELVQWLFEQDKDKLYEVKEHKLKRSLNANAYAWSLLSKIADVHGTSKEECYLFMLKRYGQSEIISVLSEVDLSGYFKYYDIFGQSELNGYSYTHYRIYKGSSEYNTKEMAILIDGIVSEAKELEIETLPPNEIERLKSLWRHNENRID